jgi:hypothetical protein
MVRPSGLPIIEDVSAAITVSVAHVEMRGRLNILPRWRKRIGWLLSAEGSDVLALMVFAEPGLILIRAWEPDGPRIQERFAEIASSHDADAPQALRLIQDRYQRLVIPARERASLGDAALAHLGLKVERGKKFLIYVCVSSDRIELMSQAYRETKLAEGHPLIDDLP